MWRKALQLLSGSLAAAVLLSSTVRAEEKAPPFVTFGEPRDFSFDWLKAEAQRLSKEPYHDAPIEDRNLLDQIDYTQHGRIRYKRDSVLWIGAREQFAITFFHVGKFFPRPVTINLVEDGKAREVIAAREAFDIPEGHPAKQMKSDHRVAGFKIQEDKNGEIDWKNNDWVSFLGASYFRSIGELYQYGLSARGLAVNPANPKPPFNEEFPIFTKFWFESPKSGDTITIYTLLEGPNVSGAFKFIIERKKQVIMDVDANVYLRNDIARLGFAPLTSMYWFSETAKPAIIDWRPEVHDSDGLSMRKGNGEVVWRPLNKPSRVSISAFSDENPKGFGLLQRDRDWHNYLEDGAYERRPSLWVEPKGDWGKGAIELLELPTKDESEDNIVAFWVPESAKAGEAFHLQYKLTWSAEPPDPPNLARVVATRLVREPMKTSWPANRQLFIVEFEGGPLAKWTSENLPDIDLWSSKGRVADPIIERIKLGDKVLWRVEFALWDFPKEPTELRLFLRQDGKPLTETWAYQFEP